MMATWRVKGDTSGGKLVHVRTHIYRTGEWSGGENQGAGPAGAKTQPWDDIKALELLCEVDEVGYGRLTASGC